MLRVLGVLVVMFGVVWGNTDSTEDKGMIEYVKEITSGLDEAKKQICSLEARIIALEKKMGITPPRPKQPEKPAVSSAVRPSSDSADVLWNKASKALFEKDLKSAEVGFKNFIRSYPKEARASHAYYWLGEIAVLNKDVTLAQKQYANAFKKLPKGDKLKTEVGVKLAETYFSQNQIKQGCLFLKETVKLQYNGCDISPATRRLLERLWQQHKCGG